MNDKNGNYWKPKDYEWGKNLKDFAYPFKRFGFIRILVPETDANLSEKKKHTQNM